MADDKVTYEGDTIKIVGDGKTDRPLPAKGSKEDIAANKTMESAASMLDLEMFSPAVRAELEKDPELLQRTMQKINKRKLDFDITSKQLEILEKREAARKNDLKMQADFLNKKAQSGVPLTPAETLKYNEIQNSFFNSPFKSSIDSASKQVGDFVTGRDIYEQDRLYQPEGVARFGDIEIKESDFNKALDDPKFANDLVTKYMQKGSTVGAMQLADALGASIAEGSLANEDFTQPNQPLVQIPKIDNRERIGTGNTDENIRNNISSMLTGDESATEQVGKISSSLKSARNSRGV